MSRILLTLALVVTALAHPAPSRAAAAAPNLPVLSGSACVPASTTVISAAPWAQQWLAPERAWDLTRGQGVTVAVIDSGVGEPASLAGAVFGAGIDCAGHGTFLASLVAGRARQGVAFSGIAPDATILAVPVPTIAGDGTASVRLADAHDLADGITAAVHSGAQVALVGAAATTGSDALRAAVRAAAAANVLVVAGVGMATENGEVAAYPAAYPDVVGVGAFGADGTRASFSAVGHGVDLGAPGVGILGAGPRGAGHYAAGGTAIAAAFVAGTAALVRSYWRGLPAAGVAERLRLTAVPPSTGSPDSGLGFGTVDPAGAVADVLPAGAGVTASPPPLVSAAVARPQPESRRAELWAVALAAGAAVAALLGWLAVLVMARGRSRGWRPPERHV